MLIRSCGLLEKSQGLYPCSIRRVIAAVASLTLSSIIHALITALHVLACIESPHFARSFQTAAVPFHDHSSGTLFYFAAVDDVCLLSCLIFPCTAFRRIAAAYRTAGLVFRLHRCLVNSRGSLLAPLSPMGVRWPVNRAAPPRFNHILTSTVVLDSRSILWRFCSPRQVESWETGVWACQFSLNMLHLDLKAAI